MGERESSNKEIAQKYMEEIWSKGDYVLEDQILSTEFVDHDAGGNFGSGKSGHHKVVISMRSAIPDLKVTIEELIAEEDKVVIRWKSEGTNSGSFFGRPATGRKIVMKGFDELFIRDGKISEIWHVEDMLSIMQQLGSESGR